MERPRSTVTILQRVLPHYRVGFFTGLRTRLEARGIALRLIYGQEQPGSVPRSVDFEAPWSERVQNRYWSILGRDVVWQPFVTAARDSDLLIIEQSNRLLLNYLLLARRRLRGSRVAFWGHGRNMQAADPSGASERLKRHLINQVDWWFAYTDISAALVRNAGFPASRITTVNNSIDTQALHLELAACLPEAVADAKLALGIRSDRIAIYCGGMYDFKRLPFLVDACFRIRQAVPDFHMLFVGDGPEQPALIEATRGQEWAHHLGPKFGRELAPLLKMSKAFLMPGLVGLAVVDSFVARVPMFTTPIPVHSPEIAYLRNDVNGMITNDDPGAYAAAVSAYLTSESDQARLRAGCAESARTYTLDNMVARFEAGIVHALNAP